MGCSITQDKTGFPGLVTKMDKWMLPYCPFFTIGGRSMPAWKDKNTKGLNKWCTSFYYEDWEGKRRHKTKRGFARKKDADEWEREFLSKFQKTPDILFSALCGNYFDDMSHNKLKPTTLTAKKQRVEKNILDYFGSWPINTIEPPDIQNWQNHIRERGLQKCPPAGYAPTYLKTLNNDIASILNYAVTFYHLPYNPCRAAGSMGRSTTEEMQIWTLDQFEAAIQKEVKPGAHLIFNILFWGGLREGEALALTPSDFLPDMQISVNKNFSVIKGKEYFLSPKTPNSVRIVAIPKFVYDEAMDYIHSLYGIGSDDRIFYFTKSFLYTEMVRISKAAGIEKIRIQDLRHPYVKPTTKKLILFFQSM